MAALLEHNHHLIRAGQVLLADKGFAGQDFKALTEAMRLRLLRPDRKDETYTNGNLGRVRQWIESVNQTLKGQLNLEAHGGRTVAGSSPASPSSYWPWPPASGTTDHRRHQQAITDRLRPLAIFTESII